MPSYPTRMERGYGAEDASCSSRIPRSYSLDLEGMLEAAEGALHHEMCELLQGPKSNLQVSIEPESCFSVPPNLVAAQPTSFSRATEGGLQSRQYGSSILSTSIESCTTTGPLQVWSTTDTRASFPAQPRSMYNCSSILISSGYPSVTAAVNELSLTHSFQPRHLRAQEHTIMKPKRATGKADHILRERLRRDDMTCKFQMLESLLPPGPKRDRATIVEDSIRHVTNLHHRMKDLQQKRSEMRRMGLHHKQQQQQNHVQEDINNNDRNSKGGQPGASMEIDKTKKRVAENNGTESSCIEKVEVHLHLPEGILIEMTCRPHAHIQSQVLAALERLRLEVSQCSISKTHGRILCSIVAQLRSILNPPLTRDNIIQALKQAVDV